MYKNNTNLHMLMLKNLYDFTWYLKKVGSNYKIFLLQIVIMSLNLKSVIKVLFLMAGASSRLKVCGGSSTSHCRCGDWTQDCGGEEYCPSAGC